MRKIDTAFVVWIRWISHQRCRSDIPTTIHNRRPPRNTEDWTAYNSRSQKVQCTTACPRHVAALPDIRQADWRIVASPESNPRTSFCWRPIASNFSDVAFCWRKQEIKQKKRLSEVNCVLLLFSEILRILIEKNSNESQNIIFFNFQVISYAARYLFL